MKCRRAAPERGWSSLEEKVAEPTSDLFSLLADSRSWPFLKELKPGKVKVWAESFDGKYVATTSKVRTRKLAEQPLTGRKKKAGR